MMMQVLRIDDSLFMLKAYMDPQKYFDDVFTFEKHKNTIQMSVKDDQEIMSTPIPIISPAGGGFLSHVVQPRTSYQLLDPTIIRNRPRIGFAFLALALVLLTIFLAFSSSSNAPSLGSGPGAVPAKADTVTQAKPKPKHRPSGVQGWYWDDPPGLDAPSSLGDRTSIWQYEISLKVNASRTDKERKHPEIAFIKGLEVGATSVSVALDHVAKHYGIKLQELVSEATNREVEPKFVHCTALGALWFHGGYKNSWLQRCMPGVRYVTMLRDPVAQTLAHEELVHAKNYYPHYPTKKCNQTKHIPVTLGKNPINLSHMIKTVDHCHDDPFRKNVTLMLMAHAISLYGKATNEERNGSPGPAVEMSTEWILGQSHRYARLKGPEYIDYLKENYFLVGVTDRLNEFLVLLALHMGWDPAQLYYVKCKPMESPITVEEFRQHFPQLVEKLKTVTRPVNEAYEWAKKDFDDHVRRLGDWFKIVVRDFEEGLAQYQEAHRSTTQDLPYRWNLYRYKDHHSEFC